MKAYPAQDSADDDVPLQDEASADDEYAESDSLLHDTSGDEALSIADTAAVTPARFYARLRTELGKRGVSYEQLPKLTVEGDTPPCFEAVNAPFDTWLSSASLLGATVPYRFDMPAEPNYCHDCCAAFKRAAVKAGTCRFPHVRFERVQTVIRDEHKKVFEVETVGVSRSTELVYDGDDDE